MAPNALAYIATSQKGMACTLGTPSVAVFSSFSLIFAKISPPCHLCRPCHHDMEGGGGIGKCAAARAVTWVSSMTRDTAAMISRVICPGYLLTSLGYVANHQSCRSITANNQIT